jgi:hypothetical protein
VQVKSEAHDKELYQQFKQDIDNEVADMRDLLRQHIMLSDRHIINANAATKLVIVTSLPHLVQSFHQECPLQKVYYKALYQVRLIYSLTALNVLRVMPLTVLKRLMML